MVKIEKTFECFWCKLAGATKEEYTYPISQAHGQDAETGNPICDNCISSVIEDFIGEKDGKNC